MFDCPKQRNIQKSSFIATLLICYHGNVSGSLSTFERSPCFDLNAQRVVVGDIFFLRHQRVYLYLVDGGADVGVCQQVVESLVIVQI